MKSKNIFNDDEISILYFSIDKYTHFKMYALSVDLTQNLILSSLNKLENISPQTTFTKQEYTILYLAVTLCIDTLTDELLPYGILKLQKKLNMLAS